MFAFGLGGTAHAASVVSGTFSVDIYNYNAGGSSANAAATELNVSTYSGSFVKSITYTGALDFETTGSSNTILDFLESGSGTVSDSTGLNTIVASTGSGSGDSEFQTTTLYVFTWNGALDDGSILHDDGISLFNGDGSLATPSSAAAPTSQTTTVFGAVAGNLKLIYSSANGNPEVLQVTGTPSAVPIPAAAWLFAPGVLGLLGYTRKRKATATA
jgi:hypothetical protein